VVHWSFPSSAPPRAGLTRRSTSLCLMRTSPEIESWVSRRLRHSAEAKLQTPAIPERDLRASSTAAFPLDRIWVAAGARLGIAQRQRGASDLQPLLLAGDRRLG